MYTLPKGLSIFQMFASIPSASAVLPGRLMSVKDGHVYLGFRCIPCTGLLRWLTSKQMKIYQPFLFIKGMKYLMSRKGAVKWTATMSSQTFVGYSSTNATCWNPVKVNYIYSKIPILRPPLGLSKSGLKDHFWTIRKVVSNQRYTVCRKWRKELSKHSK